MFGVTLALDWDPGERDIDRAQVLTNKLNGGRPEILFQAFQLPRPRNRYDPGFLSQEPPRRDLRFKENDMTVATIAVLAPPLGLKRRRLRQHPIRLQITTGGAALGKYDVFEKRPEYSPRRG